MGRIRRRRRACPGLRLTGCLLWVLAFAACSATMPPVRMNVVDEQDGRPVAGALYFVEQGCGSSRAFFEPHLR